MKSNKLKLNLQLFTDGGDGGNGEPEVITFANQSELDSWKDKQLAKSLETAKAKWETESAAKLEEAKTEAERLAKMTADEKAAAEAQKQADELAKREADITRRELKAQSLEKLAEKGLPSELIDAVVLTDADTCNSSIESISAAFSKAVEKAVNEKLKDSAEIPGAISTQTPSKLTNTLNQHRIVK